MSQPSNLSQSQRSAKEGWNVRRRDQLEPSSLLRSHWSMHSGLSMMYSASSSPSIAEKPNVVSSLSAICLENSFVI